MTTHTTIEHELKTKNVDVTPVEVEPGETLVFINDCTKYPRFEIEFVGPSPASPGDKLEGTHEVKIQVVKDGEFKYRVRHFNKKDKPLDGGIFSVRSCPGGCSH
jgi:hypothetical protein